MTAARPATLARLALALLALTGAAGMACAWDGQPRPPASTVAPASGTPAAGSAAAVAAAAGAPAAPAAPAASAGVAAPAPPAAAPGPGAAPGPADAVAGKTPEPDARTASFRTAYVRPGTADYDLYYEELRRERFLESVAQELDRILDLPAPLALRLEECGHSTTLHSQDGRAVVICYEYLDAVLVIAAGGTHSEERAQQLFSGAVTFALLSEIGEALIGLLELPVPAGAQRGGDQFAAIALAAADKDGDPSAAAALEFLALALREPELGFEYLETHAFDRARLADVACLLYGNAPGCGARRATRRRAARRATRRRAARWGRAALNRVPRCAAAGRSLSRGRPAATGPSRHRPPPRAGRPGGRCRATVLRRP